MRMNRARFSLDAGCEVLVVPAEASCAEAASGIAFMWRQDVSVNFCSIFCSVTILELFIILHAH